MRKFKILLIILTIVLGGILFFWNDIIDFYSKFSLRLPQIEKEIFGLAQEAEKQISTPPPLKAKIEVPQAFLTQAGVIKWTNIQREKYGLPPLKESPELDASTAIKTEDMFQKQYFAHISSTGEGVEGLAKTVGYEFIAIGENLALGNFRDDETLVQAWMDSPGHRENILSSQYQEIGISVLKCSFEEKITWLAVQHFGLSSTACPQPEETIKMTIESNQKQIEELAEALERLQIEIKTIKPKRGEVYIQKIEKYNVLVDKYNNLVNETEKLVNQYNNQVKIFNECVSGVE